MSETIVVEFSGDCWYNPTQFAQHLNQVPLGESVVLDMRSEGPSLESMGVCKVINSWLSDRQQSVDCVQLWRWSNPVEFVPYRRVQCSNPSHFFIMSRDYWQDAEPVLDVYANKNLFGLFLGRMTYARAVILYQCMVGKYDIFASKMSSTNPHPWQLAPTDEINLDCLSDWLPGNQQYRMFTWYDQRTVPSVDQMSVRDQFVTPNSYIDTNRSLLNYYNCFDIELVCETYTMGNTFFPTEKTIRPIMSGKPVLVYGPKYFLARLRTMGFKTYNSLWDETYDLYSGVERWQKIQAVMQTLNSMPRNDRNQLLTQAHVIALHNRQRLHNIIINQMDIIKNAHKNI